MVKNEEKQENPLFLCFDVKLYFLDEGRFHSV